MRRCVLSLVLLLLVSASAMAQQTWSQQDTLSKDATILVRVRMSVVSAAISIVNESSATANHPNRATLAALVIANPDDYARRFAVGVFADKTLTGSLTDAQLDARVSGIWDAFAGK